MNEQAKVGAVVLLAAGLLTAALFAIANIHVGGKFYNYKVYFRFGGGLEAGAPVRYAGLKAGRVNDVHVDPKDSNRVEIELEVRSDIPLRTDSMATITSLTMLTENYVEITPGKAGSPLQAGATIPSQEMQDMNALIRKMSALADSADPLIADLRKDLNQISAKADTLLANLNDVTGPANRQHLAGILSESDGMLKKKDRKSTRLNSSHIQKSRMPSSA